MAKPKIYIIEIELENIESHEHTVLKGFSPGFNCIAGMSNVGKSTVIRAVKLCAYNTFDQAMVRTGADYCRVKITTNIGYVEVKKGKDVNLWIVKRNDTKGEIKLDKVGKAEVKQACDVLGMKVIQLGETEVPINIMDQLERHFFIDGIGDKKTTGSSRAEIIDEICGLNGAEELIRAISLDQYRLTRDVTEAENRMKELEGKLFSEVDILRDQMLLSKVEKLEDEVETCKSNISYVNGVIENHSNRQTQIFEIDGKLTSLQDPDTLGLLLSEVADLVRKADRIKSLLLSYQKTVDNNDLIETSLKGIPDIPSLDLESIKSESLFADKVSTLLSKHRFALEKTETVLDRLDKIPCLDIDLSIEKDIRRLEGLQEAFRKSNEICSRLTRIESTLVEMSLEPTEEAIRNCKEIIKKQQRAGQIYSLYADPKQGIKTRTESTEKKLVTADADLKTVENRLSEIYRNITICPVTKMPIGDVCSLLNQRK